MFYIYIIYIFYIYIVCIDLICYINIAFIYEISALYDLQELPKSNHI